MSDTNRTIEKLLDDYMEALRDGCLPTFLKSLSRQEARLIEDSEEFWEAAQMARVLNGAGFADQAVTPNVGLFISRVDAEIGSRLKKTTPLPRSKRGTGARHATKTIR
jgi:hypothetical protein